MRNTFCKIDVFIYNAKLMIVEIEIDGAKDEDEQLNILMDDISRHRIS